MKLQILLVLVMATVASAQPQKAATPPAQTQTPPSSAAKLQTVAIKVTDPSGAPVPGASVRFAPMPEPKPETMQTDKKGQLTVQMKPGRYSMIVIMPGFSIYNSHLEVVQSHLAQTVSIGLLGNPRAEFFVPPSDFHMIMLTVVPFADKFPITPANLKDLPRKSVVVHDPHSNSDENYEGVLLADLLAKYGAPLGRDLRGPALANYVVATGADGYKVVYSLAELDPTFHPGDVVIADTMDGKPLDAHTGPFRLVATEDKRPARGVRNLVSIELKPAQ